MATLSRAYAGASRALGFGLSIALLALASLAAIPAMVAAGGAATWGAVALGQSVGAVGAVLVYFGWGLSGPAAIARGDRARRTREFREALRARLSLLPGVAVCAAGLGALLAPASPGIAALAAVSAASVGLTCDWLFVGLVRPYAFLLLETLPRVLGTAVGIVLMDSGLGVASGLLAILAGMLAAFGAVAIWVQRRLAPRDDADGAATPRPLRQVLATQRAGVTSSIGAALYVAAPLMIVSVVAPAVQPVFALVDKVQRQLSVGLGPVVSVLQGWVPRANGPTHATRARIAIVGAGGGMLLFAAVLVVIAPVLFEWLGGGEIDVPSGVVLLLAAYVAVNVWESVLAKVVLASYGRLDVVARATAVGAAVGLPLVAIGALAWGVAAAVAAMLTGLLVRVAMELVQIVRSIRRQATESDEVGE